MNLRTKLWLGTGLLYVLTLLMVGLSFRSVNRLYDTSTRVIKENNLSLLYAYKIDSLLVATAAANPLQQQAKLELQRLIKRQVANITEPGEKRATDSLASSLATFLAAPVHFRLDKERKVRFWLGQIVGINLAASAAKSAKAEKIGENAMQETSILATIVALIVITLAINFPTVFITPITRLTKAVGRVTEGDFGHQVEGYDRSDELGALSIAFNQMSAEIVRYRQSDLELILQVQHRTESIINRLHEPLIVTDANFTIQFFNEAARQVLGTNQKVLKGVNLEELAIKNDLLRVWLSNIKNPAPTETIAIVLEGKEHFFTKEAFAIGEQTALLGYVLSMQDVSHFKDLDRQRADFLATISHELKTPLSTINLNSNLLAGLRPGPLSKDQSEIVSSISTEVMRLISLVNSLLELSRTEMLGKQMQQDAKPTNIPELLDGLRIKFAALMKDKGIEFSTQLAKESFPLVADQAKLEMILSNLISNAVRFVQANADGKIVLSVEETSNGWQIIVDDNGPGISDADRPNIFKQYYKGTGDGTGLGLFIAKELSQQLGIELTLQHKPAPGARFALSFPR